MPDHKDEFNEERVGEQVLRPHAKASTPYRTRRILARLAPIREPGPLCGFRGGRSVPLPYNRTMRSRSRHERLMPGGVPRYV